MEMKHRYFEDYSTGEVFEFGGHTLTEVEIVAFARQFDPQPFHLDQAAARSTPYGGLIASGWHTACLMMRMLVDHFISPVASLGSPGIDELRWLAPVRPGDRLRARLTILETRPSSRRPDMGVLTQRVEMINQDDVIVMTCRGTGFYRRRPAE
jgi:acyl dehydratase